MKELSIEEKAKRYDEALEAIKSLQEANPSDEGIQNWVKDNFPELKESEDEKIRNTIFDCLYKCCDSGVITREQRHICIAWLEKQDEQNPYSGVSFKYNGHTWGMCARDNGVDILMDNQLIKHLDKQGEKEKFIKKELDCIQGYRDEAIRRLNKLKPRYNIGDVLCDKSCTTLNKDAQPNFEIVDIKDGVYVCDNGSIPVSQQDNFELVAKKIEQNPAWSERDDRMLQDIIYSINEESIREGLYDRGIKYSLDTLTRLRKDLINWVKTFKDRVQPQPKHEWSEEDKKIIDRIESEFLALHRGNYKNIDFNDVDSLSVLNWVRKIKSLCFYYRWKPSDEQMEALEYYMHALVCNEHKEILFGLYSDLKKLREE